MSAYQQLLSQIESFIKRFYLNRILKGVFLFVGVFLLALLLFSSLEYIGRFGKLVRGTFFFLFVGLNLFWLWFYVINPLLKLNKIGKRLSPLEASKIIASLIPSISDKVLNTLQLENRFSVGNIELIGAAIEQKSSELSTISFAEAIPLKENKKYAKYVLPIFGVFLLIVLINPNIIGSGSKRLINYNHVFVEPAPFEFVWKNAQNNLEEGKELVLSLELKGKGFPEKVFVVSNYGKFLLNRTGKNTFEYQFPSLSKSLDFHFEGGGFNSKEHLVSVFGSSQLGELKVKLLYPSYTGKKPEEVLNPVLMTVPEGTKIQFMGSAENSALMKWVFTDTQMVFKNLDYDFSYKVFHTQKLAVKIQNKYSKAWKSEEKIIEVVPDEFPVINVKETIDTTNEFLRYFEGFANDDYGVNGVYLVTQISRGNETLPATKNKVSGVGLSGGDFYHYIDISKLSLTAGDVLNYYFVVYDNDGVHGSKSSSSTRFSYKVPTKEMLEENRENSLSNAQSGFSEVQKEMLSFKKKMDDLRKSNINNSDVWKKKDLLSDLMNQQQELEKKLQNMNKDLEKTMKEKELFDKLNPELLAKQELLKKMLDEVMDDELKKLLEDLAKLMEQNNTEKIEEKMKDMELSNEEMNREMDRTLEMLKKMEVDEKLDKTIDKLKELTQKQEQLKKDIENGLDKQDAKSQQDSLNKNFEDVKKDLQDLEKKNEALERPLKLDTKKELQESIKSEMQDASDKLDKGNDKKAGQSQQQAGDDLESLQTSLQAQKEQNQQQQASEDMETIRAILENLMTLSFDEESLMNTIVSTNTSDPISNKLARKQKGLMSDYSVVKDSLVALSKRVPQASKYIDERLKVIDGNYASVMSVWGEKDFRTVGTKLQLVMTAYNDLALMLNESLEQMQAKMRQKSGGSGSCNNPGGKSPKPNPGEGMQGMKEALKEQLKKMQEGEKGKGGEGNKPGEGMGMPGGMSNKEIAKMAAQQSAIRKALEDLKQELNNQGKGAGDKLNPLLKELEQQEKDLVNKNTKQLVERQKQILTHMLESEKALQEREQDNKRESKEGENLENSNLIQFLEYKRKKEAEIELLRSKIPSLNYYYRQRADAYFNNVQRND